MWIGKVAIGPGDRISCIIQKCPERPGHSWVYRLSYVENSAMIYPAGIVTGGLGEKKVFLISL
jgi:hypothetical protein